MVKEPETVRRERVEALNSKLKLMRLKRDGKYRLMNARSFQS